MRAIKLTDLDPHWKRWYAEHCAHGGSETDECRIVHDQPQVHDVFGPVAEFSQAHGIWFDCPACWLAWTEKRSPRGPHGILVWFKGSPVPPSMGIDSNGKTVRWAAKGSSFEDLVLSPSILITSGCKWHGHIGHGAPAGWVSTC